MICINLKTYLNNSGEKTKAIFNEIERFFHDFPQFKDNFAFCPNNFQLESIEKTNPNLNIIAQNVDAIELGKTTGWVPAELLNLIGVKYTLFNHSEHRIYDDKILEKIEFINKFGINVIVCCENIDEALYILKAKPYAIAYEPPELIGSDISVSTQNPEIIKKFVKLVQNVSLPYIGAGLTSAEDIKISTELGSKGCIISKAFLDAGDKYSKLKEFALALE